MLGADIAEAVLTLSCPAVTSVVFQVDKSRERFSMQLIESRDWTCEKVPFHLQHNVADIAWYPLRACGNMF